MLARRLTTIRPAMTRAEALATTRIHRVAGLMSDRTAVVTTRPCRAPHHTISDAGRIGGGHVPLPGEVARALYGVRCLDARPECRRHVLEVLRQPIEVSVVEIRSPARPRQGRLGRARRADEDPLGVLHSAVGAPAWGITGTGGRSPARPCALTTLSPPVPGSPVRGSVLKHGDPLLGWGQSARYSC
jgi:hypothetical protein